ncbi:YeeE/YedE family protein [Primorskyibacter sp. S187A]|uniref:YeeE/YedE family protein n=1 Tax=Primorskyibacter sp. S187A TaxID=3415130 RepID=UPI003C7BF339
MLELLGEHWTVAFFGALGGMALGLAARLGRFCTLGAIEDVMYSSSSLRLRMWGLSIGTAILASFSAMALGLFDPQGSIYLSQTWNPLSTIIGGLLFGYGMAIAGNCGFGALARLGGGDIRAFVIVLIIGVAAYVMSSGPLASARVFLFPPMEAEQSQSLVFALSRWLQLDVALIGIVIGLILCLSSLSSSILRSSWNAVLWSIVVGLTIAGGWIGTHWVATHGFEATPIVSHTFSTPVGDTLIYAMLSSGLTVSFGIGSVFGVVLGAAFGSFGKGQFRWEACDDPRELRRQMTGAWLMGFGAVLSLGCSVGQGLSAMSLLAYSAPVALLAIFAGAWLGLRQMVEGFSLGSAR